MKNKDTQLGAPSVPYSDTKANIELLSPAEGAIAYATDTDQLGVYDGSSWLWGATVHAPSHGDGQNDAIANLGAVEFTDVPIMSGAYDGDAHGGKFQMKQADTSTLFGDVVNIQIIGNKIWFSEEGGSSRAVAIDISTGVGGASLVWHSANDGPSSGLNADLLDNLHASNFTPSDGWVPDANTWSYVTTSSILINADVTAILRIGVKVKFVQSGVTLTSTVLTATYSAPNTTIGLNTPVVTNVAITNTYYSYAEYPGNSVSDTPYIDKFWETHIIDKSLPAGMAWAGAPFRTPTVTYADSIMTLIEIGDGAVTRSFLYRAGAPTSYLEAVVGIGTLTQGFVAGVRIDDGSDNNYVQSGIILVNATTSEFGIRTSYRSGGGAITNSDAAGTWFIPEMLMLQLSISGTKWTSWGIRPLHRRWDGSGLAPQGWKPSISPGLTWTPTRMGIFFDNGGNTASAFNQAIFDAYRLA